MTTLDDTLAYVLANPLESVGHSMLVDRVTEEYDERHARGILLGFVIAAPENDGLRLAFAEWCSRNGEEKRGEFVRVQCEMDAVECRYSARIGDHCWDDGRSDNPFAFLQIVQAEVATCS